MPIPDDRDIPIIIPDTEDATVSSTVSLAKEGAGGADALVVPEPNIAPTDADQEALVSSKSMDTTSVKISKSDETPTNDKLSLIPEPEEVSENLSEGNIEEIFPVPAEYKSPDEEVAEIAFVIKGSSDSIPARPICPNPDQLHAKNLREAFAEFKEKYPITIPDVHGRDL